MGVLQWFINLDTSVIIPIIIFMFALIVRMKLGRAFRAGLSVGIGFVGLSLIIRLLTNSLGSALQSVANNFGLTLKTIDVGWSVSAAISYGTALGTLAIPVGIGVNIFLLLFGLTKTLNLDLWNYWHVAFSGSLVFALTGDFALGLYTIAVHFLLLILLGDVIAKDIERFYGFKNMTFPHGTSAPAYLVAKPLNWIFDRIPGLNKWQTNPENIQKKMGIFGDSTVMGAVIGAAIGISAGYKLYDILQLTVEAAAVMLILPKMVAFISEGLTPVFEAASELLKKRFAGRTLYIGMDSALSVGHPAVLPASLIIALMTLLFAVILPGNTVLPFGDLVTIPFLICLMVPVFKGDLLRTVIGGSIYIVVGLYIASWVAPLMTEAAMTSGFDMGSNASISSLVDGAVWTTFIFVWLSKLFTWYGMSALAIIVLGGLIYVNKIRTRKV